MDDYPAITAPAVPAQPRGSAPEIKVPAKKPTATSTALAEGAAQIEIRQDPEQAAGAIEQDGAHPLGGPLNSRKNEMDRVACVAAADRQMITKRGARKVQQVTRSESP